ncbi:MAG: Crp/Fnr family transcriptional regulator [Bacteroidia bacterium]
MADSSNTVTESVTHHSVKYYLDTFFPMLEKELREQMEASAVLKHYEAGDLLLEKGHYFRSTYLVVEGAVQMYREDDEGNEFLVYLITAGEACALSMICALKHEKSAFRARAIENTTVIAVPLDDMDRWMQNYKSWYYFVLESYRSRMDNLLEVIDQVIFRSMDERLEFYLKNKVKKLGTNTLHITHQQIANDLNSSREVISRLVKKMENKGFLKAERNIIVLL